MLKKSWRFGLLICFFWVSLGYSQTLENSPSNPKTSTQLEAQLLQNMLGQSQTPTTPSLPQVSTPTVVNDTKESKTPSKPPKKEEPLFPIVGKIVLQDGRSFEGTLYLPSLTLSIRTEDKGYYFFKTVHLSQIRSLTIERWQVKNVVNPQKTQQALFEPVLYTIVTTSQEKLTYFENIQAFNRISFENSFGNTAFFSYFIDYDQNKQWTNLKKPTTVTLTEKGLKGVIRTIYFGKVQNKAPKKKK